ncbi:LLM class flavin-dependent oxidoreductase [Paucibacter sp. R3-3]|uniref:LLM class flavin-dependent oxidoreductase n=1 Tax=Roseateles agri TaxID=3098619 RepID=A0ABU5DQW4_9BURK|nr:LLM class flavin-dependent oxidoreductase [Paucibacter sp. R3-3]MDY0747659.1 LLM class flavin-dependent oxidoreductase [Paucibacter sp. R3-3]
MASEFIWTLRTEAGDVRRWVNEARAAELAGFQMLRLASGPGRPDGWLLAARLAMELQRIRFLVDLRPGLELPAVTAQRAATLQQLCGHRLVLCLSTDVDAAAARHDGDPLNHDDRHVRAFEFLQLLRQLGKGRGAAGVGISVSGEYYRVEGGGLHRPPAEPPLLYVGGATPAAERLAAQHGQVLFHGPVPAGELVGRIARQRILALQQGRSLRFGCRIQLDGLPPETFARQLDDCEAAGIDSFMLVSSEADPLDVERRLLARRRSVSRLRSTAAFTEGVRS